MSTEATHTQQQEGARFTRDADAGAGRRHTPASILARLDRIDVWSLPFLFIGIVGTGFLFTFYDIFDINVSFIQSCVALKPGCTPETALDALKLPVVLNLAGYVVGTLVLSPLADRYGRRNMLMVTMALTGIGSLYNALAPDYTHFVIARVITGLRHRRRPRDRQHVHRRGRPAPLARAVHVADLRHVRDRRAARASGSGCSSRPPARAVAARPPVRPGRPRVRERLALDVRARRAPRPRRDRAALRAARVAALARRPGPPRRGRPRRRRTWRRRPRSTARSPSRTPRSRSTPTRARAPCPSASSSRTRPTSGASCCSSRSGSSATSPSTASPPASPRSSPPSATRRPRPA